MTANTTRLASACAVALLLLGSLAPAGERSRRKGRRPGRGGVTGGGGGYAASKGDGAAARLLKTAQDHLLAKESERGVEILKTLIQQYPKSPVRFRAFLTLGKHLLEVHKETEGLGYLLQMRGLEKPGEEITGDVR